MNAEQREKRRDAARAARAVVLVEFVRRGISPTAARRIAQKMSDRDAVEVAEVIKYQPAAETRRRWHNAAAHLQREEAEATSGDYPTAPGWIIRDPRAMRQAERLYRGEA